MSSPSPTPLPLAARLAKRMKLGDPGTTCAGLHVAAVPIEQSRPIVVEIDLLNTNPLPAPEVASSTMTVKQVGVDWNTYSSK